MPRRTDGSKSILSWLRNETLIAFVAVLAVSVMMSLGAVFLAWITYEDRYGIGFIDFLRLAF